METQGNIYDLKIKNEGSYLFVIASGKRTLESVQSISSTIKEECNAKNVNRVLVDVRKLEGRLGVLDAISLVVGHFTNIRDLRIISKAAILDSELSVERHHFLENLAVNRGFLIRMFDDEGKAKEWLG